jgi:D-alanine--D-alanine ligase
VRTKAEIASEFAPRSELAGRRTFLLVGIGGAGMSGIARMLAARGLEVRGTDSTDTPLLDELRRLGIEVTVGHDAAAVRPGDAVVLTDAVDLAVSPEVKASKDAGCPLFRRSQVLGWLLEGKKTVAVTGTHGKTTTTGMVGAALRAAGLDPTIVVGAEVPEFGGAVVEGRGDWAVVEACEAYDSFHDLDPEVVVLTNLELDHMDFHGDWPSLLASVRRFVGRLPQGGRLVYCAEDPGAAEVAEGFEGEKTGYGPLPEDQAAAWTGRHNRLNAAAALAVLDGVGGDTEAGRQAVMRFGGAERRLQVLHDGAVAVVDDYAHHPTEIVASVGALRERFSGRRVVVVYQPHLYSRTATLIGEFAQALSHADFVVLTDIYPAREAPIPGVSSFRIAEKLTVPCRYVPQRHLLPRSVAGLVQDGDVVVGMGAGNISEFAPAFVAELSRLGGRRVAVFCGGDSAEREVSLLSGRAVREALQSKGYLVTLVDASEALLGGFGLAGLTGTDRPDVCFLAVHGTNAEDGAVQGLLELLHLPYTGSGIRASALAMDKQRTKAALGMRGLPVPQGVSCTAFDADEVVADVPRLVPSGTGWVVKPNAQGSTVGLSFVERADGLGRAVRYALQFGDEVLIEEWLRGVEISVPVLGHRALPAVEIVPASGAYDFASKYTVGATEELCPARLTEAQAAQAADLALRSHQALGCTGCTRTDMIVLDDRTVVLEVNTLPGLTPTSLVPKSAATAGLSFEDLCEWMVRDALSRAEAP